MNSLIKTKYLTNIAVIFKNYSTKPNKKHVFTDETSKQRLLKVAIIGMPNAGKSTLINALMDRQICPASSKVHTTKKKSMAIFTEDDTQIVFLDTPGIVTVHEQKKFNLDKSFVNDGNNSLYKANLIGVVHDVSNVYTRERIDIKILKLLEAHNKKPSFLVLNKVDLLKQKRRLLELARKLTVDRMEDKLSLENLDVEDDDYDIVRGWSSFSETFMISSLTGDGIERLRDYLIKKAKPSPWMFPPDQYSNDKHEDLIINTVRATLLNLLPQEIPYIVQPKMELFETDENGKLIAVVILKCPNQRIAKLISGESDGRLREITARCQEVLQNAFRTYVRLRIVLESSKEDKKIGINKVFIKMVPNHNTSDTNYQH